MSSEAWTVIGTVVSLVGLAVALVQTVRYRAAAALLKKMNQRDQIANWAMYDMIVQAYDSVAELRASLRADTAARTAEIESASKTSSLLNAMWLRSVEHAALLEDKFDQETIDSWTERGRLDSEWRLERAIKLLPTPSKSVDAIAPVAPSS